MLCFACCAPLYSAWLATLRYTWLGYACFASLCSVGFTLLHPTTLHSASPALLRFAGLHYSKLCSATLYCTPPALLCFALLRSASLCRAKLCYANARLRHAMPASLR